MKNIYQFIVSYDLAEGGDFNPDDISETISYDGADLKRRFSIGGNSIEYRVLDQYCHEGRIIAQITKIIMSDIEAMEALVHGFITACEERDFDEIFSLGRAEEEIAELLLTLGFYQVMEVDAIYYRLIL